MGIFTNTDRHVVLTYRWVQEQDRNFLERLEHRFECLEAAMEFVLFGNCDAKIFNWCGELVHEHDHHHHHDNGYCY